MEYKFKMCGSVFKFGLKKMLCQLPMYHKLPHSCYGFKNG